MPAQIGNLQVRIGADIGDLQSRMRVARQEVANAADVMNASLGRINKSFQNTGKSAQDSANAFIQGRKAANDLISSIDPLYAAQQRYNTKLAEATTLLKNGSLSAEEFARVQAGLKDQLAGTGQVYGALAKGTGNARIAQLELQHVITASVDAYAAGASPLRILTLEMGRVAEAATFMGGGASGGVLGAVGRFMGGPWGVAVLLGVSVLSQFIPKLFKTTDGLDDAYKQLVKNKGQIELQQRAEEIWSHSLDGLIDRSKKLNDELTKRLQTQTDLQRQTLSQAQTDFAAASAAAAKLETDPKATQKQRDAAEKAIHDTSIALHNAQVLAGQDAGEAIASITEAAKVASDQIQHALQIIQTAHPELAEKGPAALLSESFNHLKEAINEAAGAGVSFDRTVKETNRLNDELLHGTITASDYREQIIALADSLHQLAEDAKNPITIKFNAQKNIADFKAAVFGAEGLGNNPLSSASGFGQFLAQRPGAPLTEWQTYFRQLFASQAKTMTAAQIDALRSNKDVATAIIDKATDDYVETLRRAGQAITKANLYTVHVLGAPDAAKFFAASPDQTVLSALGGGSHARAVVGSNGNLFSGTVAQAQAQLAKRIGDSSGAVSTGAAAVQQALEAMQKLQLEQIDNFNKQSAQLDAETLQARRQLMGGYDTEAELQTQEIEAQRLAQRAAIQKQQDQGKLTAEQADGLRLQIDDNAAAKEAVVAHKKYLEGLKQAGELIHQQYQFQIDDLTFADQMAKTQAEHRKIELERLDIQMKQKEEDLKRLLLSIQSNKDFATSVDLQKQAMEIQAQLARLPIERAQGQQQIFQNTKNPFEAWATAFDTSAKGITEAIQGIEVNGLDSLIDKIFSTEDAFKHLGQTFLQTGEQMAAEILKLIVKMELMRLLSTALGLSGGFTSPSLGTMQGSADLINTTPVSFPTFAASGGYISGDGTGTSDSIPAMLSNGEFVVNAEAVRKWLPLLAAINEGEMPHMKGGGIMGAFKFISPAAFLQSKGLLKYISPLAFLLSKGGGGALKFLSPLGFMASKHFAAGGMVSGVSIPSPSIGAPIGLPGESDGSMVIPPPISIVTNIDATGADPAELSRVKSAVEQMNAEMPYRVVQAYYDAVSRNVIR